ncbi:MAG: RNA methyltransferase [Thermodesulfobacteriota bacterium]|nr:RNA methyltransferase [Thermodesulfobacteriota bacterium]
MNNLYLALIHHPVCNKKGEIITSALTTIDMHDIARAAVTFGAGGFYIVTPLEDQKKLAGEVIAHWVSGVGGDLNPFRKQALEMIRVVNSFEEVKQDIAKEHGGPVISVATSAAQYKGSVTPGQLAEKIGENLSHVMAFGTAWGLSEDFVNECDLILEPINGWNGYNHLSVRSAVSIILDRICMNLL